MDYEHVLYEKEGAIIRITMNRPEKLNAMDFSGQGGLLDQFYEALTEAEDDDDCKVVVIRGRWPVFLLGPRLRHGGLRLWHGYRPAWRAPRQPAHPLES